jgi:hypothetical protein
MYALRRVISVAVIAAFSFYGGLEAMATPAGEHGGNVVQEKAASGMRLAFERRGIGIWTPPPPTLKPYNPSPVTTAPLRPSGNAPDYNFYRGPGFCYQNCRATHSADYCRNHGAANCK